jgi:acyl-CoA synthetase (NDP forming)
MALQSSDHHGELSQSSQALLDKLDELLVDCVPKEVDIANSVDYITGMNELKRVSIILVNR